MIRVEVEPSEFQNLDYEAVSLHISNKLRAAGIPIIGNSKVRVEIGILESIYLVKEDKMLYQWRES